MRFPLTNITFCWDLIPQTDKCITSCDQTTQLPIHLVNSTMFSLYLKQLIYYFLSAA